MSEPATVYNQILAFSEKQTPWKQDMLRRVVQHGQPSPTDLAAAVEMCKAKHGLQATAPPKPVPLTSQHLIDVRAS